MKSIYYIIIACFALAVSMGCSDFLDEKPKSEKSKEDFLKKPDEARAAVNTLYRSGMPDLHRVRGVFLGSHTMLGGYLSGLYDNEYKGQSVFVQYLQTLNYTPVNISDQIEDVWYICYLSISRANYIIQYIDRVEGLGDAEKQELVAQAKFFRAASYFYLVRFFGGVPLITESYESMTDMFKERASVKEIYALIEDDLKEAVRGGLNDKAFVENGFRVTKGAAEMLLADVYLHMSGYPLKENRYADAVNSARSIIKAGKHSLAPNGDTPELSAYNKLRTSDNLTEYIYALEYNIQNTSNGDRVKMALPAAASSWGIFKAGTTCNSYAPTGALLNLFDKTNDLRVQEKQYIYTSYSWEANGETVTKTFDPAPYFFFDEEALLSNGISPKDIPVYRYAETLLIAAEAIAESEGVTDEAVDYLTQVRSRAYTQIDKQEIKTALKSLSKEAFIQEVWNERIRELLFECRTWTDIQRTRKYPVASGNGTGNVNYIDVIGAVNPWGGTYEEKHLLFPIPHYEKQRNPNLVQNPGY